MAGILVALQRDNRVAGLDIATRRFLLVLEELGSRCMAFDVSRDSCTVAAADSQGTVAVWRTTDP